MDDIQVQLHIEVERLCNYWQDLINSGAGHEEEIDLIKKTLRLFMLMLASENSQLLKDAYNESLSRDEESSIGRGSTDLN